VVWKLGQDVLRALVVELLSDDALARLSVRSSRGAIPNESFLPLTARHRLLLILVT
jgi:hypothetical protein